SERCFFERSFLDLINEPFLIRTTSEDKSIPVPAFDFDFSGLILFEAHYCLIAEIIGSLTEIAENPVSDHKKRVFFTALDVALLVSLVIALFSADQHGLLRGVSAQGERHGELRGSQAEFFEFLSGL